MEIETNSEGLIQIILNEKETIVISNKNCTHFKKIHCFNDRRLEEIGEVIL